MESARRENGSDARSEAVVAAEEEVEEEADGVNDKISNPQMPVETIETNVSKSLSALLSAPLFQSVSSC